MTWDLIQVGSKAKHVDKLVEQVLIEGLPFEGGGGETEGFVLIRCNGLQRGFGKRQGH